ncbi:MAG: PKD domain-containing protein, partial [Bacteroidia bacterium]|nr:PKD domain-containing protein [Bacteroidia bacterium]
TSSIVVAWGFLGTGSVRVFDSVNTTGCSGFSLPLVVTVTDKPTAIISGANSLCADAITNYGTIPAANKFYMWGALGGTVISGQGTSMATISWDVPGTGYVYLYDSLLGSSCAAYAVKEVAVNPNPTAIFTTSQSMGAVTFTPSEPNLQCKWYFGDGDSSTQYSPTHSYASNGTYTVTLLAKTLKGCGNTTSTDVNMTTVSISKYIASGRISFTAYPNPFIGSSTISLTTTETQEIGLDIYDMSGRLISTLAEPKVTAAGTHEYPFVSGDYNASSGIYLVRLKVGDQYQYLKLVEIGK